MIEISQMSFVKVIKSDENYLTGLYKFIYV